MAHRRGRRRRQEASTSLSSGHKTTRSRVWAPRVSESRPGAPRHPGGAGFPHPTGIAPHLKHMPGPTVMDSNPVSASARAAAAGRQSHPLDNPIWNSLLTEHSELAITNRGARRYPSAIGPLSGIPQQSAENYEALRALAETDRVVVLFCTEVPAPPSGWTLIRGGLLTQMICEEPRAGAPVELTRGEELRPLTGSDVPEMVALAELTEPGPFRDRTIELGAFFGIFAAGRLVAMAGERL